jgi:hypothetical protein
MSDSSPMQPLFAAEIRFRCLYPDVPEQRIVSARVLSCLMTKSRACSPKIVRCDVRWSALLRCMLDHGPDDLRAGAHRRNPTRFVNGTEHGSCPLLELPLPIRSAKTQCSSRAVCFDLDDGRIRPSVNRIRAGRRVQESPLFRREPISHLNPVFFAPFSRHMPTARSKLSRPA